jgi:hypothetical protein
MGGIKGRKSKKRLERRREAYDAIPQNNDAQNPGKQSGGGHKMHRPGSNKR